MKLHQPQTGKYQFQRQYLFQYQYQHQYQSGSSLTSGQLIHQTSKGAIRPLLSFDNQADPTDRPSEYKRIKLARDTENSKVNPHKAIKGNERISAN